MYGNAPWGFEEKKKGQHLDEGKRSHFIEKAPGVMGEN